MKLRSKYAIVNAIEFTFWLGFVSAIISILFWLGIH